MRLSLQTPQDGQALRGKEAKDRGGAHPRTEAEFHKFEGT